MADIKLVQQFTNWNPGRVSTTGQLKNRWIYDIINDLKKLKLRNWSQIIKNRKARNDMAVVVTTVVVVVVVVTAAVSSTSGNGGSGSSSISSSSNSSSSSHSSRSK